MELKPLEVMVYKVLPLVYDDSLSYYEVLCKVVDKCNEIIANNGQLIQMVNDGLQVIADEVDTIVTPEFVAGIITQDYFNTWLSENTSFTDLQSTVADQGDTLTTQGNAISGLIDDMAAAEGDIETINGSIETMSGDITSLQTDKAAATHTHALNSASITGILPITKGGTGVDDWRDVQNRVYKTTNANGETDLTTISAYPTRPGLYRVGVPTGITGLPSDYAGYGPLIIWTAGDYTLHLCADSNNMLYFTRTNGMTTPTTWRKVTSASV